MHSSELWDGGVGELAEHGPTWNLAVPARGTVVVSRGMVYWFMGERVAMVQILWTEVYPRDERGRVGELNP